MKIPYLDLLGPGWVKNGKKAIFISATSLATQFFLKANSLTAPPEANFQCEFTEKCFASFEQSSQAICLKWYKLLLFFQEFTSISHFMT